VSDAKSRKSCSASGLIAQCQEAAAGTAYSVTVSVAIDGAPDVRVREWAVVKFKWLEARIRISCLTVARKQTSSIAVYIPPTIIISYTRIILV